MSRKEFPARVKSAALKRSMDAKGQPRCEGKDLSGPGPCLRELRAGDVFIDHIQPDGLGGEPIWINCQVLCGSCHAAKTHKEDNPRMQKADRVRKKNFGIKRNSKPLPGTKRSGVKKKMNGDVERRT